MTLENDLEGGEKVAVEVNLKDKEPLKISLAASEVLYVLGANGAGKSTLLYSWAKNRESTVLIAGNREVIFDSSAVSISAAEAKRDGGYEKTFLLSADSRVEKKQHNNVDRLKRLLFRLKSASEYVNKRYRQAHQQGNNSDLDKINASEPTELLNKAFQFASIPIKVDWNDLSELMVKKTGVEAEFGIQQMSDGERAALILTGEIILAERDALVLIDEPERHLHRAISSPLLEYLRGIRTDLRWVIATHDLSLPRGDVGSNSLILYEYLGQANWVAELISDPGALPSALAEAVYGARQKVIFVEGTESSRDIALYQQIFKGVTIIPVGHCRNVCDSIAGFKTNPNLHHMDVRGIVDGDNRSDAANLQDKGIYVLGVYAIESIYYHPDVISIMIKHSAEEISQPEVIKEAIGAVRNCEHLAKMTAYRSYREEYQRAMLDDKTFFNCVQDSKIIDGPKLISAVCDELEKLKKDNDWLGITKCYKIKASGAPDAIAKKLGFGGDKQYENALIKKLNEDETLRDVILSIVPNPFI